MVVAFILAVCKDMQSPMNDRLIFVLVSDFLTPCQLPNSLPNEAVYVAFYMYFFQQMCHFNKRMYPGQQMSQYQVWSFTSQIARYIR